ncbi:MULTISPECIES: ABC transporter substrate-binding protein [unclassified Devosia]|uniref:ABC transporter substrate-binding protein n=1 Tax=unclassified Devosia TaxID=196773 RepID=UPI0015573003|nr:MULTISPECIES: ABC transporter substrate-binding protein [unclassified Devosia]
MKLWHKALTGALLSSVLALSVTGTALGQGAGTLNIATPQDPGSWDPIDTFLVNWSAVANNVFDGLVARTPELEIVPALATEWEISEDGLTYTFKLREGVKFHNGEAFDADAVKFTFDRLLGEEGAVGPQQSNYNSIESVEVVDPKTVVLHLSQPDPVLLTKLTGYGAMIVPPDYIAEKGDEVFNTQPVGTGPFRMASYEARNQVTLEAFPEFWGEAPKLQSVVFRFITEPSTAVAELQSGRIDMVIPPSVPVGSIPTIEQAPNLKVVSVPGPTVYSLRFKTDEGITADERVRRALVMAVDRDTIIEAILAGQATPISSFQSAQTFGNDPDLEPIPFDPEGAKALLAEAGVEPGATVQIDVRGNDATFNEVAQAVAAYLSAVGITATIQPYETNVLLNDIIPAGRTGAMWQQSWGAWTFDYDNTAYLMYHEGEKWNPYGNDPELDALLESQRSMTNVAERETVLKQIAKYVADQALEMPLYNVNQIYAVSDRVGNFVAPPDSRLRLTDVTVE